MPTTPRTTPFAGGEGEGSPPINKGQPTFTRREARGLGGFYIKQIEEYATFTFASLRDKKEEPKPTTTPHIREISWQDFGRIIDLFKDVADLSE